MKKTIGFDMKVLLHQLDYIAKELPRTERKQLYSQMDEYLTSDISGTRSRVKTRTILFKVWGQGAKENEQLENDALALFPNILNEERIVLHWGLSILAYSFFKDLAATMGNMFRLQGEVSSEQIGRKMKSLYGDSRRIEITTNAVLTSLRSWGVIEAKERHIHRIPEYIDINNIELKQWLVEVLLKVTCAEALNLDTIQNHTMFFPFRYAISQSDLKTDRFSMTRQGIDTVMIGLKKSNIKDNVM
jgi:hypothetical protein